MTANDLRTVLLSQIEFLKGLANRLDGWANQSVKGGWSTHQVEPNRDAANDCRRVAALGEEAVKRTKTGAE